jgi:hypothetical protein
MRLGKPFCALAYRRKLLNQIRLPVATHAADGVMVISAPAPTEEFSRPNQSYWGGLRR